VIAAGGTPGAVTYLLRSFGMAVSTSYLIIQRDWAVKRLGSDRQGSSPSILSQASGIRPPAIACRWTVCLPDQNRSVELLRQETITACRQLCGVDVAERESFFSVLAQCE
jgi:hypothetical protein